MGAVWSWAALLGAAVFAVSLGPLDLPLAGGVLGLAGPFLVIAAATRATGPPAAPRSAANRVTLARLALLGGLAGQVAWALASGDPGLAGAGWSLAAAYTAAALGDGLDGRLARRTGASSPFGARLDAEADALGIAAAGAAAVLLLGTLPGWYLIAAFARYLFGAGLALEHRTGRIPRALPGSRFRRRLAGFQMGLLAVCLGPWVRPGWALPSTLALGAPFLVSFVVDYLLVTGRLEPDGRRWSAAVSFLRRARRPGWRVATGVAAALGALALFGAGTGWWALGAFFLAWLLRPECHRVRPPAAAS